MATIMALYKHGRCAGRCDANCYDAAQSKCTCICGGLNHRKGKALAIEQTRAALTELENLHREAHDYNASQKLIFPLQVLQRPLPLEPADNHEANRTQPLPVPRVEHTG